MSTAEKERLGGARARDGYDGFARKVRKTAGSGTSAVTTRYLLDGDQVVMELSGALTPLREYSYYPGVDDPASVRRSSDGAIFYYALEAPGSVAGLVDSTGGVVSRYEYGPFGEAISATEGVVQPYRYAAREYDSETGLYYYRARYYDPALGRFSSADPIGLAGGMNPHAYVGNSPVNGRDPSGLCPTGQVFIDSGDFLGCAVLVVAKAKTMSLFALGAYIDCYLWLARWGTVLDWTLEFATGKGPAKRNVGASRMTGDMQSDPAVSSARAAACASLARTGVPVANDASSWGLNPAYPIRAGLNPTRQFVGSFNVYVKPGPAGYMTFTIANTTSLTSASYKLLPSYERSTFSWFGNVRQTFTWTEPLSVCSSPTVPSAP